MDGILLINKPKGWTSFDAVAKVRGALKKGGEAKPKVGHTGTLDPLATGLLVLLVGKATKQASELSKADKTYQASLKLGENSSTGDDEGEKIKISDNQPSLDEVQAVLNSFLGEIEQIPPAYSAIKVDGQRAYKLARQGKEVKIEPRLVKIYEITDVDYQYPNLNFSTKVSSGTYIRTLAEDIGKNLGSGAYLTNLKRTQVGAFELKDAISVDNINAEAIYNNIKTGVS